MGLSREEYETTIARSRNEMIGMKVAEAMMKLKESNDILQEVAALDAAGSHYPWLLQTGNTLQDIFIDSKREFGGEAQAVATQYGLGDISDLLQRGTGIDITKFDGFDIIL